MIITVSIIIMHHLENKEKESCRPCFAAQAAAIEWSFGTGKERTSFWNATTTLLLLSLHLSEMLHGRDTMKSSKPCRITSSLLHFRLISMVSANIMMDSEVWVMLEMSTCWSWPAGTIKISTKGTIVNQLHWSFSSAAAIELLPAALALAKKEFNNLIILDWKRSETTPDESNTSRASATDSTYL